MGCISGRRYHFLYRQAHKIRASPTHAAAAIDCPVHSVLADCPDALPRPFSCGARSMPVGNRTHLPRAAAARQTRRDSALPHSRSLPGIARLAASRNSPALRFCLRCVDRTAGRVRRRRRLVSRGRGPEHSSGFGRTHPTCFNEAAGRMNRSCPCGKCSDAFAKSGRSGGSWTVRLVSNPAQRWSSASDFRRCGDAFGNETTVTAIVDEWTGRRG